MLNIRHHSSQMIDAQFDLIVIGAGIVGLSTAMQLSRQLPKLRVGVLEKEELLAAHQSGRNSGVIHSGIYYKPGSLKAQMCVEGAKQMVNFCEQHAIAFEICGKVIIATDEEESLRLEALYERGEKNGLRGIRRLAREQLREIEPHCAGISGLYIPSTGITDYRKVCSKYRDILEESGGELCLGCEVKSIRRMPDGFVIETPQGSIRASYIVNCAGLHSDTVSRMTGIKPALQIVPFRGEYYDLCAERQSLVRGLVYPVPDPRFPFLGVHFTRRISGGVDAGPNAVLALKREGYKKLDASCGDIARILRFPGFWRMASQHWRSGLGELYRSFSKKAFVRALQRLVPEVTESDLVARPGGVRAQAVRADGSLVDDFVFQPSNRVLNVCNVPSPAATASLPIGRAIAAMASSSFGLQSS